MRLWHHSSKEVLVLKNPNYGFEKRQREAAKEKKREAKRLKKQKGSEGNGPEKNA